MKIYMSDYTLATLLVLVSTVTVSSATSNIHDKRVTRIIVDPSSFVDEEIEVVEYPGQSRIQCFAVFLTMQDTYKTFCHLPTGGCMASDVEFPVNYDDMPTGHGYVCYTTALPLIDRGIRDFPFSYACALLIEGYMFNNLWKKKKINI